MNFDNFTSIPFPRDEDIVYVLCFLRPGTTEEIPFYVGESTRSTRRIGDYITAQFAAPTDFKVGVVVKALQAAGAKVVVKYKLSNARKADEARLIAEAAKTHALLNHEPSFNYKTGDPSEQQKRFEDIARSLLDGTHLRNIVSDA